MNDDDRIIGHNNKEENVKEGKEEKNKRLTPNQPVKAK